MEFYEEEQENVGTQTAIVQQSPVPGVARFNDGAPLPPPSQ